MRVAKLAQLSIVCALMVAGSAMAMVPTLAAPSPASTRCGGDWAVQPSPNVGRANNSLDAVSALSPSDVWAVGNSLHDGAPRPLIEHWDGVAWSVVDAPFGGDVQLLGVAAVSSSDAWAVGYRDFGGPIAMHWDGSSWKGIGTPNPGHSYLLAVSASSPTDVWAGGFVQRTGGQQPFLLHWNGGRWQSFPAPMIPSRNTEVYGVATFGPDDAWAVGNSFGVDPASTPYVIHWDGSSWRQVPPPAQPREFLSAVSGTSSNDVWVVGSYGLGGVSYNLTQHWDGAQWSTVPSPSPGPSQYLSAVDAASVDRAWAVGSYSANFEEYPLIVAWDGTAWSVDPSPVPNPSNWNLLKGVSADSTSDAWAVGNFVDPDSGVYSTLTEHRCD